MRMTGPEDDAQTALPFGAPQRAEPRDFHHGGVRAAIVHRAVVPGVVVAGVEHERLVGAGHVAHEDRRLAPASVDLGTQRRGQLAVRGKRRLDLGAGFQWHSDDHGRGKLGDRLMRRIAPDRRDAHLVHVLVRADVKLPGRARERGTPRHRRIGDPFHENDAAAHVLASKARLVASADIDQFRVQAGLRRGPRERMGDAGEFLIGGAHGSRTRQADEGVMQDEVRREPVSLHLGFDIFQTFELLGRAGVLGPAVEHFEVLPHARAVELRHEIGKARCDRWQYEAGHWAVSPARCGMKGSFRPRTMTLITRRMAIANRISREDRAAMVGSCHF
jgi:hypothetical protein